MGVGAKEGSTSFAFYQKWIRVPGGADRPAVPGEPRGAEPPAEPPAGSSSLGSPPRPSGNPPGTGRQTAQLIISSTPPHINSSSPHHLNSSSPDNLNSSSPRLLLTLTSHLLIISTPYLLLTSPPHLLITSTPHLLVTSTPHPLLTCVSVLRSLTSTLSGDEDASAGASDTSSSSSVARL